MEGDGDWGEVYGAFVFFLGLFGRRRRGVLFGGLFLGGLFWGWLFRGHVFYFIWFVGEGCG